MADNYIGLVTIGTNQNMPIGASLYGTCSTAAATAQKEVTLDALNRIFDGLTVRVKFTTANSAGSSTALKFSGMGTADPIVVKNYGAGSSVNWNAGAVIDFTFDGTNWVMHSNNTTYSTISETEVKDSTSTASRLITGQRVNQAIDNKLSALVDTLTGSPAASKTITAFDQVDGKVSATFANIAIAESQVTNLTTDLEAKMPKAGGQFTGNVTFASGKTLTVNTPTADGHAATKKYVDDKTAGLTGAMHFKGTTTTVMSDGLTTAAVTISGSSYTPAAGDVVLYSDKEFVWTGSLWELLGAESSYKIQQTAVSDPTADGNATSFIDTISQNANGDITVTKKTVPDTARGTAGLVTLPTGSTTTKFLREDGTWAAPAGTNYSYGKVTVSAQSTAVTALTSQSSATTPASKTPNETLKFTTANKWIVMTGTDSSTAGSDEIKFAHSLSGATAASYGDSDAQTPGYGGTFKVPYLTVDAAGHVTGISEHNVTIPASDNTDEKLKVADTNPSSQTTYYAIFGTGTAAATRNINDGLQYITKEGTTSAAGDAILKIGNNLASTTAKNKTGRIRIYGGSTTYLDIMGTNTSSSYTITLPKITANGNLVGTSTTSAVGSGKRPVYIAANGIATAMDYTFANSLTTINYLSDANYVKTAEVTNGVLTITTVSNASSITVAAASTAS